MLATIANQIAPLPTLNPRDICQDRLSSPSFAENAAPPKTIALSQTIAPVIKILGQPQKIINLGDKQIYF
jgi:hypothetical protein